VSNTIIHPKEAARVILRELRPVFAVAQAQADRIGKTVTIGIGMGDVRFEPSK